MGSLVVTAIVALVLFGVIPYRTRVAIDKSRKHEADRFSASLHLVRIDSGSIIPGAKGNTMPQAAQQLTREKINEVRAMRRASIRRRQILVLSLLVIAVALVVCARVFDFTPLWALIPVVLVAIILFFGSRAAKVARAWEESVTTSPTASSMPTKPHVTGAGVGTGTADAGQQEVLETAPTYVIPVDDVREVLRKQAEEKAAAISRHQQRKRAEQKVSDAAAAPEVAEGSVAQGAGAREASDKASGKAEAGTVAAAEVDDSTNAVAVVFSAAVKSAASAVNAGNSVSADSASADSAKSGDKDLISFSLGSDAAEEAAAESVKSAEIKSYRQVAQATPLSAARQAEVFADVTPSVATLDKVSAPSLSADSLGVDVDAVIARRQS